MTTKAHIVAIARHRLATDGDGVTTLVVFHACPLRCRWCLNPQTWRDGSQSIEMTPQQLLDTVKVDNLYFQATGGGITFGGGEPALRSEFIEEFRRICPPEWKINIETALNVPQDHVRRLIPLIHEFVIDIKDMNPEIYQAYTGKSNAAVMENLRLIAEAIVPERCRVRIPLIPQFNTDEDRDRSEEVLRRMGFTRFDRFNYKTDINR